MGSASGSPAYDVVVSACGVRGVRAWCSSVVFECGVRVRCSSVVFENLNCISRSVTVFPWFVKKQCVSTP